jgi:hypothetical protein
MDYLGHALHICIDTMRADQRFASWDGIADSAKRLVDTENHLSFFLHVATSKVGANFAHCYGIGREMVFSNE